jgi:hypothetical protein
VLFAAGAGFRWHIHCCTFSQRTDTIQRGQEPLISSLATLQNRLSFFAAGSNIFVKEKDYVFSSQAADIPSKTQ